MNPSSPLCSLRLTFRGTTWHVFPGEGLHSRYRRLFGPGARFGRFIEACRATVERDEMRRNAAEAMHILVDEAHAVIPLAGTYRRWGSSERVHDFSPHPSSLSQRWGAVWIEPPRTEP